MYNHSYLSIANVHYFKWQILRIRNHQGSIIFLTLYNTSFYEVLNPNCYPIHCISSLLELFRRLTTANNEQQEEDPPEEVIPPPSEFRTSESTDFPEWSDAGTYTIPADDDEVFSMKCVVSNKVFFYSIMELTPTVTIQHS